MKLVSWKKEKKLPEHIKGTVQQYHINKAKYLLITANISGLNSSVCCKKNSS